AQGHFIGIRRTQPVVKVPSQQGDAALRVAIREAQPYVLSKIRLDMIVDRYLIVHLKQGEYTGLKRDIRVQQKGHAGLQRSTVKSPRHVKVRCFKRCIRERKIGQTDVVGRSV